MAVRKYVWPNEQAMKYFWKVSSDLWSKKLDQEGVFDQERVSAVFNHFQERGDGRVKMNQVVPLTNALKLHHAVCYKDLSFHFKFLDVINGHLSTLTYDGTTIEKDLFLKWWFADLDTIRPLEGKVLVK